MEKQVIKKQEREALDEIDVNLADLVRKEVRQYAW